MKKIITKDGSITFFNEKYQDIYHSKSGALEEAFKKFAEPCRIKPGMKIMDICFGIGYNCLAAINKSKKLRIVALEKDKEILKKVKTIKVPKKLEKDYGIIKEVAVRHYYKDNNLEIKLLLGDARKTIKNIKQKFDVVFLDPFSPKTCPELWTAEFFAEIKKRMKKGAFLATYSCARAVRDNLKSVGLAVRDGPSVGRNAPSTLACNS